MSSSPYMKAAILLSQIWETKKSIKTLAYDKSGDLKISKSAYAQVCHVLEHQRTLQEVLAAIPIACRNEALLYVLLYELLLGPNQKIRGGGALKRQIVKKESELREVLGSIDKDSRTVKAVFPRYVRVNTLKCDLEEAVKTLKLEFYQLYVDKHIPNLLVLKPAVQIHDHQFVQEGKFILQDKSSCFSALCLVHGNQTPLIGDCLDACAAPGNKTSHLAALTNFKVYACDRNEKRLQMLDRRMNLLVSTNRVVTTHIDFLRTNPCDYSNVKGILLDPSCSGSGIFTSLDRLADDNDAGDRIQHLSNFQLTALQHAMTFDSVDRIVYSTCSLYEQENELVVKQALQDNHTWQLRPPHCLIDWERRGRDVEGLTKEQSSCLIRADRDDETNGFFVAYFERRDIVIHAESSPKMKGHVVIPDGVTSYSGQYARKIWQATAYDAMQSSKVMVSNPIAKPSSTATRNENIALHTEIVPTELKQNKVKGNTTSDRIIAKKRAKKIAWKQQQVERKKQRLVMKESPKL